MRLATHYDAVIVGGGHNGLVAACYLAQSGQSVLVLERNTRLGGAAVSDAIFPGMDARVSRYAYLVSLFPEAIVRDLGLRFQCRRRAVASATPYERDGVPDALVLSHVDAARSEDSFSRLTGPTDRQGYRRLRELEAAFARHVWPSVLEPLASRQQWTASLDGPLEREAWNAFVEQPLGETIERLIQSDVLRGLVFTDAKIGVLTWPHDPSLLQNRCFVLHVIGGGDGEWKVPVGGMGALVHELERVARSSGASLVTEAHADAIEPDTPCHTVRFRYRDEMCEVGATRVLVNAGPQVAAQLLGRDHEPSAGHEGSVCKVNMLLRRLPRLRARGVDPREAFAGTFHLDETYSSMQASFRQAMAGQLPDRPPAELYCHSLTDTSILGAELRDAGYHTLTLFGLDAPYRLFTRENETRRAEMLRRYMRALDEVLADPIEECLATDADGNACIEIKTAVDLEVELALPRGNIFHGAPSTFFTDDPEEIGRWGVETQHERIYLCGSCVPRGGGVSGIAGHNAARRIFEDLGNTGARLSG